MENLQLILGADKCNPLFSLYSPTEYPEQIEVYFGLALVEKIEKGKSSLQFKLLLGRLYNAGYKRKELTSAFDVDLKTIRKWGYALKSNDFISMEAAFAGHEAKRKLSPDIESYARSRFREIYPKNQYNYSAVVRDEISEYFQTDLSGETLRGIFNCEKMRLNVSLPAFEEHLKDNVQNSNLDMPDIAELSVANAFPDAFAAPVSLEPFREQSCDCASQHRSKSDNIPKQIPSFAKIADADSAPFVHHAGILLILYLILPIISKLPLRNITGQWMMSILLGAVNIEQSRRLDFKALRWLSEQDFITTPRASARCLEGRKHGA